MAMASLRRTLIPALVLFGLALAANTPAFAQEPSWAEKMFETLKHDFGTVARGADVSYRFKVTNLYKEAVHISNVRTTCGCSAATPSKTTLASREVAYVEVTMDTRKFTRRKDSNLIVTFDAPLYAEVKIPITAYIRTDVVLTPGGVSFGAVEHGAPARQKIEIAYAGRPDWTIRGVRLDNEHLTAEVVERSRAGGRVAYDLLVELKPDAPVGQIREQLMLLTDDADSPQVPVIVEASVEADITITPSVVSFGTLIPGQSKIVSVVIRGKKPFAIEKIECESDLEAFSVRMPKESKVVHVLPLTISAPNEPGLLNEEFTVSIAGRPEPIVFKAYGNIVEVNPQAATN